MYSCLTCPCSCLLPHAKKCSIISLWPLLMNSSYSPSERLSCSPPCSKNPANIWEVFLSSSLTMSFWISDFIMALGFPSQDDSSVMEYTISGLILLISSIPFLPQLLLSYLSTLCPVHVSHCHVSVSGACTTVGSECLPDNAPTTIPSHPSVAGNDFTTFIFLHNT